MRRKRLKEKITNTPSIIEEVQKEIISEKKEIPKKNAISIIIPVKDRVESTKKLIEELIYQKTKYYPETEIIVIENGSTEDMSFLDNYNDIIVKHENIEGVSHARNTGLDLAHGCFIAFIDNDDFISRDYLHQLYQVMRNTNCDWARILCQVDNTPFYDNNTFDINNPTKTCKSTVCYCYKNSTIGENRFNENLNVGEDIEWIEKVIRPEMKGAKCSSISYFIKWNGNEDSLSHKYNRGEITREK